MVHEHNHQGDGEPSSDEQHGTPNDATGGSSPDTTRRSFLRASASVGALALGLGGTAAGARVQETCSGGSLDVNSDYLVIDNQWDNPNAQQCVWVNDDGSYGWDFDATGTSSDNINYPQGVVGTKPWTTDTGVADFPVRCGNVNELIMETDADINISGGEWDWAEEWWLTSQQPPIGENASPDYEVMLLLDYGGGHGHGTPVYEDLWTDQFGNTIDLWAHYGTGGTSADFYIFRVDGRHGGGKVDLGRINEWMINHEGVDPNLWLTGIELGNEYWGGAVGKTTVRDFDVKINGTTYTSGSQGGLSDGGSSGGGSGGGGTTSQVELPATLEAEDYTNASDATAGNTGGAYRSGNVDIEATSDSQGGGYNVGWIEAGEWLEYEVSVPSETTYDLGARVASNAGGGAFTVTVDGSQVASTSFAATGGWQTWTTASVGQATLSSGTHTVRVTADAGGWNFNFLTVTEASSGGGGGGTASHTLPGRVEAEDYDSASDATAGNTGGAYRSGDVDIAAGGSNYNVGWVEAGEWLEFEVEFAESGRYELYPRVASNQSGGAFHVEVDGANASGTVSVPNTGGWSTWTKPTVDIGTVSAGVHTVRIYVESAAFNLDYVDASAF